MNNRLVNGNFFHHGYLFNKGKNKVRYIITVCIFDREKIQGMIWILFYYNSLPDVPEGCRYFSNEVVHRDFFMCNPTNTGHYEYPKFEKLSYDEGCHGKEVRTFLKKDDPEKYVILYTRNDHKNKVVGYFQVGKRVVSKGNLGFISSETVLLPKRDCIPIRYTSRGVPVSWGNSSIKKRVDRILDILRSKTDSDISSNYQKETIQLMNLLENHVGRTKVISICEKCPHKMDCYWGRYPIEKKLNRLNELYGQKEKC